LLQQGATTRTPNPESRIPNPNPESRFVIPDS
jgi:hypothetical protein